MRSCQWQSKCDILVPFVLSTLSAPSTHDSCSAIVLLQVPTAFTPSHHNYDYSTSLSLPFTRPVMVCSVHMNYTLLGLMLRHTVQ